MFFTNDYILFIQTKTTLFGNVAVRFTFLKDFPFNLKRFLGILQVPNIFGKFCAFAFERTGLLCDDMMDFMFGIHE